MPTQPGTILTISDAELWIARGVISFFQVFDSTGVRSGHFRIPNHHLICLTLCFFLSSSFATHCVPSSGTLTLILLHYILWRSPRALIPKSWRLYFTVTASNLQWQSWPFNLEQSGRWTWGIWKTGNGRMPSHLENLSPQNYLTDSRSYVYTSQRLYYAYPFKYK